MRKSKRTQSKIDEELHSVLSDRQFRQVKEIISLLLKNNNDNNRNFKIEIQI